MRTSDGPGGGLTGSLLLSVRPGFNFWRTVRSHGWSDLPPFRTDHERRTLERVFRLPSGGTALCRLSARNAAVSVSYKSLRPLSPPDRDALRSQIRSCLRMDEDFSDFYAAVRSYPRYRWIALTGSGRLLRAPTVFEDIIKMLLTTNCSWALTRTMATNVVEAFGGDPVDGRRAFPEPKALAGTTEHFLRSGCRIGYRSPFLLQFSEEVARGRLPVEAWRKTEIETGELFALLCSVKGIGPYAAGNILKLLGHYEHLGLDSWVRAKYSEIHAGGRKVQDRTIERRYAPYGKWRGLLFWLEMTRYWHDKKFTT